MSVKEEIVRVLEGNRGVFISGEKMAEMFGVSRAAISKAVRVLQKSGYSIQAIPNRGYVLSDDTDVLSSGAIENYLGSHVSVFSVETYDSVGSTNDTIRLRAQGGAPEFTVVVAATQTDGRGRRGRLFFSPVNSGLYMSVLLRPKLPVEKSYLITAVAAVAVSEAIEEIAGMPASIKWVNDVFVEEKKVCGILTEGTVSVEAGSLEYAVVGIGVNAYIPASGFPDELAETAGALFTSRATDARNRLAASILLHFENYYRHICEKELIDAYKARSFLVGRKVTVISEKSQRLAQVHTIDDDLNLVVTYEDGSWEALHTGEVSIHL